MNLKRGDPRLWPWLTGRALAWCTQGPHLTPTQHKRKWQSPPPPISLSPKNGFHLKWLFWNWQSVCIPAFWCLNFEWYELISHSKVGGFPLLTWSACRRRLHTQQAFPEQPDLVSLLPGVSCHSSAALHLALRSPPLHPCQLSPSPSHTLLDFPSRNTRPGNLAFTTCLTTVENEGLF